MADNITDFVVAGFNKPYDIPRPGANDLPVVGFENTSTYIINGESEEECFSTYVPNESGAARFR